MGSLEFPACVGTDALLPLPCSPTASPWKSCFTWNPPGRLFSIPSVISEWNRFHRTWTEFQATSDEEERGWLLCQAWYSHRQSGGCKEPHTQLRFPFLSFLLRMAHITLYTPASLILNPTICKSFDTSNNAASGKFHISPHMTSYRQTSAYWKQ